jgi:hypothetical protein
MRENRERKTRGHGGIHKWGLLRNNSLQDDAPQAYVPESAHVMISVLIGLEICQFHIL